MIQVKSSGYTKGDWYYLHLAMKAVKDANICFTQGDLACFHCDARRACFGLEDLANYAERKYREYEHRD